MAEFKSNDTAIELGELLLNKRGSEMLRINKHVNNETGEESYDVRRWYYDDNDEAKPTSKGIRIKKDMMRDVISIILNDMGEDDAGADGENVDDESGDGTQQ